jgi:hypothetical protein
MGPISLERTSEALARLFQTAFGNINRAQAGMFVPGRAGTNIVGPIHTGNHPNYTKALTTLLTDVALDMRGGLRSASTVLTGVNNVLDHARGALVQADGLHINDWSAKGWERRINRAPAISLDNYAAASRAGSNALRDLGNSRSLKVDALGPIAMEGFLASIPETGARAAVMGNDPSLVNIMAYADAKARQLDLLSGLMFAGRASSPHAAAVIGGITLTIGWGNNVTRVASGDRTASEGTLWGLTHHPAMPLGYAVGQILDMTGYFDPEPLVPEIQHHDESQYIQ